MTSPSFWLDAVPMGWIWVGSVILFVTAGELAFRLARSQVQARKTPGLTNGETRPRDGAVLDDQRTHAGVLLGALLALLGLLLAFSFNIVESRFQSRKQLVLQEANAIGTTYLRAGLLPAPHPGHIRGLLHAYVKPRLAIEHPRDLPTLLAEAENFHARLWRSAEQAASVDPDAETVGLFLTSLNDVIDLHQERITVSLYHRLPRPILISLFLLASLSIAVLGFSAGLGNSRTPLPTAAVMFAIALVVSLIIELDRPWQRIFDVNQQALGDVERTMREHP